jgi:hypothetical protein
VAFLVGNISPRAAVENARINKKNLIGKCILYIAERQALLPRTGAQALGKM